MTHASIRRAFIALALSLATALAGCAAAPALPAAAPVDLAIVDVAVIDPRDGTRTPARTVLVDDGRVVAITDAATPPRDAAVVVDASGRFLIPGLQDMHVHALWDPAVRETMLPALLAHGVTGVRDMGGTLEVLAQVRAEQAAGWRPWPRIVASGPVLDGPQPVDPSISLAIASPDDARAAVARLAAAGVDFVKVYTLLPPDAYRAAVEAAHAASLPVAGHVPYGIAIVEAAAGMRSIEHLRAETGGICAELDADACAAAWNALRAHGTWATPTLVARRPRAEIDDARYDDPALAANVPCMLRGIWTRNRDRRRAESTGESQARRRAEFAREMQDAASLPARGIALLAGSDAGSDFAAPGAGLHDELALLVAAGLSPRQALQAATSNAADFLGDPAIGRIAAGGPADLVLLDADPLVDIGATRRIAGVVRAGRWLDRAALDALLADAARASACPSPTE